MSVLLGEASAHFLIERGFILRKRHGSEHTFEAHEGMIGSGSAALEYIVAVLAIHNNRIAAICGLACFAKAAQEFGNCSFHDNLIIRSDGRKSNPAARLGPCSVKACGKYRRPPRPDGLVFEVAICDLKAATSDRYTPERPP
jgi:hypothetical protein